MESTPLHKIRKRWGSVPGPVVSNPLEPLAAPLAGVELPEDPKLPWRVRRLVADSISGALICWGPEFMVEGFGFEMDCIGCFRNFRVLAVGSRASSFGV